MIANWLVNLVGVILFLFLFWKRLKEDYSSNIIFGLSFFVLLGVFLGYLTSRYFFPHWFFWFEAFGAFLGFAIGIIKFNTRFFETYEALFISFLPWFTLFYLVELIKKPSLAIAVITLLNFSLILLFDFVSMRYKNFSWYKSGKIGLAGLLTSGVFFLLRAAIATLFTSVISFLGLSEIILSGVCAFTIFLLIYNLSKDD
ncbi:MAG: hypothetical protein NTV24_04140 [Candidatus Woesebacteria bacterium]|nr:hypothetical protein [Candidatus Woesebacteria bacterium]